VVETGLDLLVQEDFRSLKGRRVGLLVHPASVDRSLVHAADRFLSSDRLKVVRLFGPQHGIRGETQDNMIEWQGFTDPKTGIQTCSLYGEHRKPTPAMLEGLDDLIIDLQDAGSRVYTFNWTMLLCMEACAAQGVRVIVLDRPNPVSPQGRDGPMLDMGFKSFVGLAPIPLLHGLTSGELAVFCNRVLKVGAELEVRWMRGYRRSQWFEDTGLPYVFPSPNLPTLDSCVAYPGFVLLEGTNISEGRGTTRPFEVFGAPFVDADALAHRLADWELPGAAFRPMYFQPAFQKWAGEVCGGVQLHLLDRHVFRPVLTAVAALCALRELHPDGLAWKQPPYEYERVKLPFDILAGGAGLRSAIDAGKDPRAIAAGWKAGLAGFSRQAAADLHYD